MGEGTTCQKTTILSLVSGPHTEGSQIWCRYTVTKNTIVAEENIFYDSYEDVEADLKDLQRGPLDLIEEEDIYDEEYSL